MPSAGVLILVAIVGSTICAKSRFAGGAIFFALVAVVLFISTPMGAGLPGALSTFLSTFDNAATPVLNGTAAG
ncbi:MAG: hypothetical protein J0I49_18555 [Pseudonocardia sp.]|uniref:hypothetical protein n=1 Tax=Pseudonocardia sp. TaxID=60912 RepID=UPI001ACCC528|nr:hypothetical protein [Pseudonocardia sp.]MBN9100091.1 hypothetical protein [Pseudonocardia sp.]